MNIRILHITDLNTFVAFRFMIDLSRTLDTTYSKVGKITIVADSEQSGKFIVDLDGKEIGTVTTLPLLEGATHL